MFGEFYEVKWQVLINLAMLFTYGVAIRSISCFSVLFVVVVVVVVVPSFIFWNRRILDN